MKITPLLAAALLSLTSYVAAAPTEAALQKEAKVSRSEAERTALAKAPHGKVSAGELEREHGRLIWSFDIAQKGTRDIKEVQVDAKTGQVVSVKTENPKAQAKEAAADKAEKNKR